MAVSSARVLLCSFLFGFVILWSAQVHGLPPGISPQGNSTLPVEDTGQEPDAPPQAEQTGDAGALTLGKPEGNTSGSEGEQPEGACGGCDDEGVTPLESPWLRQGRDRRQQNQTITQPHAIANAEPLSSGPGEEVIDDGAGTDNIPVGATAAVSPVVLQSSGMAVYEDEDEAETNFPVGATAAVSPQVAPHHWPVHHQPALGLHVRGNVGVTPDTNDSDDDTETGHDLGDNFHMRPGHQLHNENFTDTNLNDIDLARERAQRAAQGGQSGSLLVLVLTCMVLLLRGHPVQGRAAVRGQLLQHSHNGPLHHIELPPSWLLVSLLLAVMIFINLVMQS